MQSSIHKTRANSPRVRPSFHGREPTPVSAEYDNVREAEAAARLYQLYKHPINPETGRAYRSRKPKANAAPKPPRKVTDSTRAAQAEAKLRERRITYPRDLADYNLGRFGYREVTREGTIADVVRMFSASAAIREQADEARAINAAVNAAANAAANALPAPQYPLDVPACVLLHREITAASLEVLGVRNSEAEKNWFGIYGSEAESKRPLMSQPLARFLEEIEIGDPHPPAYGAQSSLADITDPAAMFGEDATAPWHSYYRDSGCVLLYKSATANAGLVLRLGDGASCWRSSLFDQPRDDWNWMSLQEAMALHLKREQKKQGDGMMLEYRPKTADVVEGVDPVVI